MGIFTGPGLKLPKEGCVNAGRVRLVGSFSVRCVDELFLHSVSQNPQKQEQPVLGLFGSRSSVPKRFFFLPTNIHPRPFDYDN